MDTKPPTPLEPSAEAAIASAPPVDQKLVDQMAYGNELMAANSVPPPPYSFEDPSVAVVTQQPMRSEDPSTPIGTTEVTSQVSNEFSSQIKLSNQFTLRQGTVTVWTSVSIIATASMLVTVVVIVAALAVAGTNAVMPTVVKLQYR